MPSFRILKQETISHSASQKSALEVVQRHAIFPHQQLLLFIFGPGGTGKTFLVKTIVDMLASDKPLTKVVNGKNGTFEVPQNILILTPTGVTSQNIKRECPDFSEITVSTFHKYFNKVMSYIVDGSYKDLITAPLSIDTIKLREEFKNCCLNGIETVVIDEVSMFPKEFLNFLIDICSNPKRFSQYNKTKKKNIIFCGDLYQLPPVPLSFSPSDDQMRWMEENDFDLTAYSYGMEKDKNTEEINMVSVTTIKEIYEIIQRNGFKTVKLVENMRTSEKEHNEILADMRNFKFDRLNEFAFKPEKYIPDSVNLYYANKFAGAVNRKIHDSIVSANKPIEFKSSIRIVDISFSTPEEKQQIEDMVNGRLSGKIAAIDYEKYHPIMKKITMQIGASLADIGLTMSSQYIYPEETIMVRKNMYDEQGCLMYANGSMLELKDYSKQNCSQEMATSYKDTLNNVVIKAKYILNYTPIVLAYAMTVHKTQGIGFSSDIFINIGSLKIAGINLFPLLYVALSRKKGDSKIFFNKPIDADVIRSLEKYAQENHFLKTI